MAILNKTMSLPYMVYLQITQYMHHYTEQKPTFNPNPNPIKSPSGCSNRNFYDREKEMHRINIWSQL